MRVLALGDIHLAQEPLEQVLRGQKPDLVIITGDLTNFGRRREAECMITAVRKRHHGRLLAVAGNLDHPEVAAYLAESGISLHGRGMIIDDVGFFGLGGSNPTPFHTPLEFSETELARLLESGHRQVRQAARQILVSHAPPHGTRTDCLGSGTHVGSLAVRRFIDKVQPDLCLCGHIHESRGMDQLGRTLVLNPGLVKDGGWIGINIISGSLTAGLELATAGEPRKE
jgi:uncharacterized protein